MAIIRIILAVSTYLVDSVIDLGVMYCNKLKRSMHVDNIVSKASLGAKLILHCFETRDPVLLSKAFCTFCQTHS